MGKFSGYQSVYSVASGARGAVAPADQWDVYHSEPARAASVASDVAVPALQSLISGVVAGAVTLALCVAFGWQMRIAGAVALAVLALAWVWLLVDHRRLLWAVENLTHADVNRDGAIGQLEPARLVLEVKHSGGERSGFDFLHLGIDQADFLTWARAVLGGQSLAVGQWVGRGRLFTRGQYDALMSELERAGIVRAADARNPQSGRELSPAGRAALRACVREHVTVAVSSDTHGQSGEGGQAVGYIVLVLGMLVLLVIGWRFVGDALDAVRVAAAAKATEANAALVSAQAALAEAQARVAEANAAEAQAENDALLHKAAAYSIEKQADLVAYYAVRGDVRVGLMLLAIFAACLLLIAARVSLKRLDEWQGVEHDQS
jgi:hypothetical protein